MGLSIQLWAMSANRTAEAGRFVEQGGVRLATESAAQIASHRWRMIIGAFCALIAVPGHCQVYVGSSIESGSVVLSNFASLETPDLLLPVPISQGVVEPVKPPVQRASIKLSPGGELLRSVVESVAQSVDIAPQLLHAVISAESNYNASAVSPKGAMGLMQLMPATAKRFGVKDPFLAKDNILGGASYLKWLMGFFKGDVELALAGYNAGEQAVVRAGHKVPNYPETQAYVRRIMADLRSTNSLPL